MIRPLRKRHRMMVCALSVLLPAALVVGIVARRPVAAGAPLPVELTGRSQEFGEPVWTQTNLWPDRPIITRLRRDASGSFAVELIGSDLAKPDVLVYWATGLETANLPNTARLVGPFSEGTPLRLPTGVVSESGRLLLYSLADHQVVNTSKTFIPHND